MLVLVLNVSAYLSVDLMSSPHSLGYVSIVMHVAEIPFVSFGLFWLFNKSRDLPSYVKKILPLNLNNQNYVLLLLCIIVAMLIESAQIVETGTSWLTLGDVQATTYILQHQKNNENFSLISSNWGSYPLYYFTGTEKYNGGFPIRMISIDSYPGFAFVDRADYYYQNMQNSTDESLLVKAC